MFEKSKLIVYLIDRLTTPERRFISLSGSGINLKF